MWLQCQGEYDCVGEYDSDKHILRRYSRRNMGAQAPKLENIDGWFADVSTGIFILFRKQDEIIFRAYEDEFVLDGKTEVDISGPRQNRQLLVKRNGKVVHRVEYTPMQEDKISGDSTPFSEDEDFDFGLFVSNISKDPKRKDVFLKRRRSQY
jgi:hypothetical protein